MGSAITPENAAATAPRPTSLPVTPAIRAGEAATGNRLYQSPPSVAPSGNDATAACCAMIVASTGPSTRAPGVACLAVNAPAPSAISVVVISAAAARVPV